MLGVVDDWEIENKLHWVRDVTYQEDKSLVRTRNAPRVMASLRSLAISLLRLDGHSNIAAANRHHARDPPAHAHAASDRINDFAGSPLTSLITSDACLNWQISRKYAQVSPILPFSLVSGRSAVRIRSPAPHQTSGNAASPAETR
jgi:hypothetical protein